MEIVITVASGRSLGKTIRLKAGQSASVGRSKLVDFTIDDNDIELTHFTIKYLTDDTCRLIARSTAETIVNGRNVTECVLTNRDRIRIGSTIFEVEIPDQAAPVDPSPAAAIAVDDQLFNELLIAFFRNSPQPLFGLLDAARNDMVLALLMNTKCRYQSLYEGTEGELLADVAPYLVEFSDAEPLLPDIINGGWFASWGVFLTSQASFEAIRRNFRRFLIVKSERGEEMYFRFYDPRVLRHFLPSCTAEEAHQFFGPVDNFYLESSLPNQVLRFSSNQFIKPEILRSSSLMPSAKVIG